ncbi:LysR family transcriptional regulator [Alteribacillus iranensis]|uniref:DNA-binding transcriptional regulator, LysR family n=1 Tax=Alteribacillus iranensis TaxID=930128 RepID=A0A1I2BF68_9BACI|nr:LysR family transcriptional regulator [Alteribacillus iranensis]SFE54842.1 DNA-binding transcriptional regulator, LysR family [Alteribacillus iranensis]
MLLRQLEYFVAVCEELHFTRAAEKLGITQPSLSQQIRELEHEMGTPLFDRIGKKISITSSGKLLLEHSQKIFQELEEAHIAISELNGLQKGHIKIGSLLTVVNYLLPPTVIEFRSIYPGIKLSILGLRTVDIYSKLLEGDLDIGVVSLPVMDDRFEFISLYSEEISLAVSVNHELSNEDSLSLEILKTTDSILPPTHYYLRQAINESCKMLGFEPKPVLEMTTMESIINMVKQNVGVSVLPRPYLDYLKNKDIKIIPITAPAPTREIGIIYQKEKYLSLAVREFIKQLEKRPLA